MSDNKTRPTPTDVDAHIDSLGDADRIRDSRRLIAMMEAASSEPPVLWGKDLIGFGSYHYKYESGREGDFFRVGFSPRKREFSIYLMADFDGRDALLGKLGKHRMGKACLYIKSLDAVDADILEALIRESLAEMKRRYG